jgi:hypothetical protein
MTENKSMEQGECKAVGDCMCISRMAWNPQGFQVLFGLYCESKDWLGNSQNSMATWTAQWVDLGYFIRWTTGNSTCLGSGLGCIDVVLVKCVLVLMRVSFYKNNLNPVDFLHLVSLCHHSCSHSPAIKVPSLWGSHQSKLMLCHTLNLQKCGRNTLFLVVKFPGLKWFVLWTKVNCSMPIVVDSFTFQLLLWWWL